MTEMINPGVTIRRSFYVWGVFVLIAGLTFLLYGSVSLAVGGGAFVMPLDDVYIHFQYAHQIAVGQPYVYNPGLDATSGATSLLYPYLLAVGDLLGFDGLLLGGWALGLGALGLLGSMWLVYCMALAFEPPHWLAVTAGASLGLTGAAAWHFMSGMETGLLVFLTLLALYMLAAGRYTGTVAAASLAALARPEGAVLALLASVYLFLRFRRELPKGRLIWLALPVLAVGVQPLVNLLATGSAVAAGNQAKSLLATIPADKPAIAGRILDNFTRMWAEFATGTSPREGLYLPHPVAPLAAVGVLWALWGRERRLAAWVVVIWALGVTGAIATLEPAFWHFKRYQMPVMALFFPLMVLVLAAIQARWSAGRYASYGVVVLVLATALWTNGQFLRHYQLNSGYVARQPLAMARWLQVNTPPDAVIAVHDVGSLRYVGGRTTIDMVGLTTPGAAEAWRNGPGAVMEFLERAEPRPDYVASYGRGHGFGLDYLAATSIYGEALAAFPVAVDDRFNVALAGDFQGVYRPDWSMAARGALPLQPSIRNYLEGFELVDQVDVADLESEAVHAYHWSNREQLPGFPSETFEQEYVDCSADNCRVLDGGRRINGEERFMLDVQPGRDVILVTRLHPQDAGTFEVFANGNPLATRWIPQLPGRWLEVATLIPAGEIDSEQVRVRIVAQTPGGHYMPYQHWAYQGMYRGATSSERLADFQDGAIVLASAAIDYDAVNQRVSVELDWQADGAQGDYVAFVHLYDDVTRPPLAQVDRRPGAGTLPPGNWLPGSFRDTIVLNADGIGAGVYRIAVGFYDPMTNTRLAPSSGAEAGRLFIGQVEVE